MLATLEKVAGDKLLQLPTESLFTKGLLKLLDILNVDYRESHSESDMQWRNPSEIYTEGKKEIHISQLVSVLKLSKATKIKALQFKSLS